MGVCAIKGQSHIPFSGKEARDMNLKKCGLLELEVTEDVT